MKTAATREDRQQIRAGKHRWYRSPNPKAKRWHAMFWDSATSAWHPVARCAVVTGLHLQESALQVGMPPVAQCCVMCRRAIGYAYKPPHRRPDKRTAKLTPAVVQEAAAGVQAQWSVRAWLALVAARVPGGCSPATLHNKCKAWAIAPALKPRGLVCSDCPAVLSDKPGAAIRGRCKRCYAKTQRRGEHETRYRPRGT